MSAPEAPGGVRIRPCAIAVSELCAARGRSEEFAARSRQLGAPLPTIGHVAMRAAQLLLCIRPARWLLLEAHAHDAAAARDPHAWPLAADPGAVIDLSGGMEAFVLQGSRALECMARGCRLDLDPQQFPVGRTAATIMAQVPVTLASLPAGLLLLTPASTARHFHEWLVAAARPLGLVPQSSISMIDLCRSRVQ